MPKTLSLQEKSKILKQVQAGNIDLIKDHKINDPNFHWCVLKYERTGDTVLHCAARLGYCKVVQYLLTFHPSAVNCKNNDDKTALHEAAQFSQVEVVRILLENGAKVNALKRADWTPLMLACTKTHYGTVKLLMDNGAVVNFKNKDGWSSLHLISREGCGEILKLLINSGGDHTAKTKNGRTPLHIAALHDHKNVVDILLKLEVNVDDKDNCGNTALHEAVLGRSVEICRLLVQKGADVKATNNVDFNLLHLAASEGYNDLIEFIVGDLKFDTNITNLNGLTALHCAARKNQKSTFQLLINLGCDQYIKDKFGRLASDYLKR